MKTFLPGIDLQAVATAVLLIAGATVILRMSMPKSSREDRKTPARRLPRGRRPDPAPIAGGATLLLESIPYLEKVHRGRGRNTVKLLATIAVAASLMAGVAYVIGRTLSLWLSTYSSHP